MTSPFLPISNNTSGSGIRTSDVGTPSVKPSQGGEGEDSGAFAEILVGTQELQKQEGDASTTTLFPGEGPVVDQDLTLEVTQEEFLAVLTGQALPVLSGVTSNSTVAMTQSIGNQQIDSPRHESVVGHSGSIQNISQNITATTSLAGINGQEAVSQRTAGHPANPLEALSHVNRGTTVVEPVGQPVDKLTALDDVVGDENLRLRPLLKESLSPILAPRSPLVLAENAGAPTATDVQQSLTKLAVAGNTSQANIGALYAQSRLPQPSEDGAQSITRTDGEAKATGHISLSPASDTGLGTTGSGVPFGNAGGNGHTQFFESAPGTQQALQQSQIAGRSSNFDERLQLLNTTAPQRLQIDVQLSEATRVQVDVGVQQRQVFAGVLMDNPVLRSLASQNIQALEEQLGQADLELEEFDVHGDGQLLNESTGQDSDERKAFHEGRPGGLGSSIVNQSQGQSTAHIGVDSGWHLVA